MSKYHTNGNAITSLARCFVALAETDVEARAIAAELNTLTDALRLAVEENEAARAMHPGEYAIKTHSHVYGCGLQGCGCRINAARAATDANATIAAVRKEIGNG